MAENFLHIFRNFFAGFVLNNTKQSSTFSNGFKYSKIFYYEREGRFLYPGTVDSKV